MKCDEIIEKIKQADDDYRHRFVPIHLDLEIEDVLAAFYELKNELKRRNKKYAFALSILERYKSLSDTQTALDNKDLYDIYSKRSEIHYKRANKWAKIYLKLKG